MFSKIVTVLISLIFILTAACGHCSAQNSFVMGSRWDVPQYEVDVDREACDWVVHFSNNAGCFTYDWYGSQTTRQNILDAAQGRYGNSISFYIGHGENPWGGSDFWIYDDDGTEVHDNTIYSYTYGRWTYFAFLWSCFQAHAIDDGMPEAWLHTVNLSDDGYHNPDSGGYTFVGFIEAAPYLSNTIDGVDDAGKWFIYRFYYQSQAGDISVNDALDFAADQWGQGIDFDDCPLYTHSDWQMWVYGDGNKGVY